MIDDSCFETFAHYALGLATMSFAYWTVKLYKWRKRNRMTFLLFLAIAYIALGFIKDVVFLLPMHIFDNPNLVENLVSIFDLSFVPLVCAFFLETTHPGVVSNKRLLTSYLSFIIFLPLYCIFPLDCVLTSVYALSLITTLITLIVVPINVVRYNKFLSDNFSYTKDITVGWCVGCVFSFFVMVIVYELCFYNPTWFGEMVYDILFVVIWNIVCLISSKHHVVMSMMTFKNDRINNQTVDALLLNINKDGLQFQEEQLQSVSETPLPISNLDSSKDAYIASSLKKCMETQKIYLNPKLSLTDLSLTVGTNKTYISNYINSLGKTFYDYVNEFRVEEACRIIDQRSTGQRISMTDVAKQSGFNSISSFNRYFFKMKGVTPSSYLRR